MPEDFFTDLLTRHAEGVRLVVRAKPGLSRPRPPKIVDSGDGKRALEITVAQAAQDGKANKALIAFLAKELGLKKADVSVRTGETCRLKTLDLHGDAATLEAKTRLWLKAFTAP